MTQNEKEKGSISSKFVQFSAVTLIATIVIYFKTYLLTKMFTGILPIDEFAIFTHAKQLYILITTIVTLSIPSAIIRFLPAYWAKQEKSKAKVLFGSTSIIALVLAILSFLILLLFQNQGYLGLLNNESPLLIMGIVVIALTTALNYQIISIAAVNQEGTPYLIIRLLQEYLALFCALILIMSTQLAFIAVLGLAIGSSISLIASIFYLLRTVGLTKPSVEEIMKVIKYSTPYASSNVFRTLMPLVAIVILEVYYPAVNIAYFGVGITIAGLFLLMNAPMNMALHPAVIRITEEQSLESANSFTLEVMRFYLSISLPVAFVISQLKPLLIVLFADITYLPSAPVIDIMIIGYLMLGLQNFASIGVPIKYKTNRIAIMYFIAVAVSLIIGLLIIPILSITGAAIIISLTHLIYCVLIGYESKKLINTKFISKSIILLLTIALVCFVFTPIIFDMLASPFSAVSTMIALLIYTILIFSTRTIRISEIRRIMNRFIH